MAGFQVGPTLRSEEEWGVCGAAGICMAGASGIMGRWRGGVEIKLEADEEGATGCAERGEFVLAKGT